MKRTAAIAAASLLLVLTGCTVTPDRVEVADRFLVELTDSDDMRDAMAELADGIAGDMLDGNCGSSAYEAGLSSEGTDPALFYAWRSTCLMYFEDDLTEQQVEETKAMQVERAIKG